MELGQPGITLKMLVDAGIIFADTTIYGGQNNDVIGTITADGLIRIATKNNTYKTYGSPSGAAKAVRTFSINGWIYWKILEPDGYKELAYYRGKYNAQEIKDQQEK